MRYSIGSPETAVKPNAPEKQDVARSITPTSGHSFFIVHLITHIIAEGFKAGVGIKAELPRGIYEFHWLEI